MQCAVAALLLPLKTLEPRDVGAENVLRTIAEQADLSMSGVWCLNECACCFVWTVSANGTVTVRLRDNAMR